MKKSLLSIMFMALGMTFQAVGAITWETKTISSDADVINQGTLMYAYALGYLPPAYQGTTVEVNGVRFEQLYSQLTSGTTSAGNDNMIWSKSGNTSYANNLFHNSGVNTGTVGFLPGVTGLSDSYTALLFGGFSQAGTGADANLRYPTLELLNLTVGHQYVVQLWFNDSRSGKNIETKVYEDGDASNAASGLRNATGSEGGLGFVATGTFVADSESIKLMIEGRQYVGVNAIQIRDLGMIPEPAAPAFLLSGLAGLFFRRKR